MRTDGLVDEIGRVQVFHGNADGVCAATGLGLGERDWRYMRRSFRRLVVLASILALLGATVPVASAAPAACENRNNNTIKKLLECVDVGRCSGAPGGIPGNSRRQRRHPGIGHGRL